MKRWQKKMRSVGWGALWAILVGCWVAGPAQATLYETASEDGKHDLRLDARIRQGFAFAYQNVGRGSTGSIFQNQSDEYLVDFISNYSYQEWMRVKLNLNLWGDLIHGVFRHDKRNFGYKYQGKVHSYTGATGDGDAEEALGVADTCRNGDCNNFLRDHLIRELSLTFTNREKGYTLTLGKFQRGWGQADGLRLMDVINPLDHRKRFLFRDFEELRIEQWMADLTLFLDDYLPLDRLGIKSQNLELIWIPNVRHNEFHVNNFFDQESGGRWGFHLPRYDFSPRGPLPDRVFVHLNNKPAHSNWWSWDQPAFAARYAWQMWDTELTLNGYYGWQDMFISRVKNSTLHLGPNGRTPVALNPPPFNQPVSPALSELAFQWVNAGLVDLATGTADSSLGLPLPPLGSPGIPGGLSVRSNIDLDFRERKKLIGFTGTREMHFLKFPPKGVSPVFRLETSYEFQKPFNTVRLVADDRFAVVRHDFWSTLFGVDYFLWLPDSFYGNWLLTNPRSIFTSFQFFLFKVKNNGSGNHRVLWQAPYRDWKRPDNELWFTFTWNTEVYKDLINVDALYIYDQNNSGLGMRHRVTFRNFGDKWRPRLEWIHMEGKGDKSFGAFDRNDSIEFEFVYQF
ncbi:MAG: hypothetical protein HYS70_04765 [Nitrospinae bacterium]|nr:hypothetical protein [Nitrospinota bacterium]